MDKANFLRYGLPFIIAVVGGSFVLKSYTQVRYDYQKNRRVMSKVSIDEEFKDYREKVNLDDWKNIRGPRPWEVDDEEYKSIVERRVNEAQDKWSFKSK